METSMARNAIKILVLGVFFLPSLVHGSKINGDPKELFGTGEEPASVSLDDCNPNNLSYKNIYFGWSQCWMTCEALLPEENQWPNIVNKYGQGQGDIASLWRPAVESFINFRTEQTDQDVKSSQTGKEFKKLVGLLHQCHALVTITSHSDYSSDEFSRMGRYGHHTRKSLVNPELKCKATGYDTQDYPKCTKLIKFYDTFTFGKKAKETVDKIRFDDHVSDQNDELVQKRLKGDSVGAEDSLNVQKESFKKQKNIATENMVVSAAQAASLTSIISSMPTLKSLLQNECLPRMEGKEKVFQELYDYGKNMADAAPGKTTLKWPKEPTPFLEADPLCANIIKMDINLILNTDARNMGIMLGVQSGFEALANLAKGALLKKRIKGLDGAIKKIEEFKPEPLTEEEMEDIYFRECVAMPDLPKCQIRQKRQVEGANNSYSFGTETKSTVIGDSDLPDDGNSNTPTPRIDRSHLPGKVGISLPDASSLGSTDFSGSIPPGAAYSGKGSGNSGGGGGGGGGAGSASPPGGSAGGGRQNNTGTADTASSKVQYDGSGGGWKGYNLGGGGRNRRQSQSPVKNPFAKLFGKNGKKGSNSELIDFRNPASKGHSSNKNIFQRLSKRYKDVSKKKQLLEYSVKD